MGCVPSNFGDYGGEVYFVPYNFCNWLSFSAEHCGQLTVLLQTFLLNIRGEGTTTMEEENGPEWVEQQREKRMG